jgi:hypothetical protein
MQMSNHTKLMNSLIGMCKPHKKWVNQLHELGYRPHFIEKTIKTTKGSEVKTDLIATSNKLVHSLVVEVKGGRTINPDQMERYSALDKSDLFNWVQMASPFFTSDRFQYDWCVSDIEENHPVVSTIIKSIPIITFGRDKIEKTGQFSNTALNQKFSKPISTVGLYPPTFYYPFGENDSFPYIAQFAIQALLQIAMSKQKNGKSVFDDDLIKTDGILKFIFNPVLNALSPEHRENLKEKIQTVIRWALENDEMKEAFGAIEQQGGYKIKRPLDKLDKVTKKFLANLETQSKLDPFQNPNWYG